MLQTYSCISLLLYQFYIRCSWFLSDHLQHAGCTLNDSGSWGLIVPNVRSNYHVVSLILNTIDL
ncbi:hypothetical protein Patl1_31286 [Pistacia atlantica]|uniref:Uncharacterized protein n=1 Tax=Pistacia atlantica TaxID=434234 RepID=A0ACC1AES8_9ROSI|nr:hypothetical protein Patl1_31286 [Pistacia atlantica]